MKKIILSLMAASFAAVTFAHGGDGGGMEQGNILLYGVGTYTNSHGTTTNKFGSGNSNTSDNPRERMWEVSPGVGFNITDCITVGVDAFYTGSRNTTDRKNLSSFPSVDQVKSYDYGVGPFARLSCPLSEHFFAFGQFSAHYLRGRETFRTVTALTGGNSFVADDDYKGVNASLTPAVGAMLTKTLGLTFSIGGIGYDYRKYDYSPNDPQHFGSAPGSNFTAKTNDFYVTFGQQMNVGIQKYFGCGHRMHKGNAEMMDDTRHMDTKDDEESDGGDKKKHHRRNRKNDDE